MIASDGFVRVSDVCRTPKKCGLLATGTGPFIPLTSGALIEEANNTPSSGLNSRVDEAAGKRGFRTGSDFIRHALEAALDGAEQETALDETEQRMIAGLDRIAKEIRSVRRVQQAQFAFVDTLLKVVLSCLPEPGGEV
jgi:Arc/MetJ-type ribon-helix-helix transcriptional regulator